MKKEALSYSVACSPGSLHEDMATICSPTANHAARREGCSDRPVCALIDLLEPDEVHKAQIGVTRILSLHRFA